MQRINCREFSDIFRAQPVESFSRLEVDSNVGDCEGQAELEIHSIDSEKQIGMYEEHITKEGEMSGLYRSSEFQNELS
jgi:hypothetical protein